MLLQSSRPIVAQSTQIAQGRGFAMRERTETRATRVILKGQRAAGLNVVCLKKSLPQDAKKPAIPFGMTGLSE